MSYPIKTLTIEGFKSIKSLKDFELRPLNVLIGANGAGKSNFVEFFSILQSLISQRLQVTVGKAGGADRFLFLGPGATDQIVAKLNLGGGFGYEFALVPTVQNRLIFGSETVRKKDPGAAGEIATSLGSGHQEANLVAWGVQSRGGFAREEFSSILSDLTAYQHHFLDTSPMAAVRLPGQIHHNDFLYEDASNLAALLFWIKETQRIHYGRIRDVVRLAAPFFDDFKPRPVPTNPDLIQLEWLQKDSDYPFLASQLSDGTLRFICLAAALLQSSLPSIMLFDEPELGLHPYALTLLAGLFQQAAKSCQVIVSTQSAPLLNEFVPEDVIVVEREHGQSTFRRLESTQLSEWLQEYSLGELWQKNVLGGRPRNEEAPFPVNGQTDPNVIRR